MDMRRTFFNGKKKLVRENYGSKIIELGLPAASPMPNLANFSEFWRILTELGITGGPN